MDKEAAIIESNNMVDNDKMEMMTHFNGPTVDIIHDTTTLITFDNAFKTPPPSANASVTEGGLATNQASEGLA